MSPGLRQGTLNRDPFLSIKIGAFVFKDTRAWENEVKRCKSGYFFGRTLVKERKRVVTVQYWVLLEFLTSQGSKQKADCRLGCLLKCCQLEAL